MATYTDQRKVHGNTIWYDAELENLDMVNDIAEESKDWLDFIAGTNQQGYIVTALPNGTYSVDKKSLITRITLRLPKKIYEKIWQIHTETRKSLNTIIIELIDKGLQK